MYHERMKVCKVCSHELLDNMSVTRCGHMFHAMCLNIWKQSFSTCPTCYQTITGSITVDTTDDEQQPPQTFRRTRSERFKSRLCSPVEQQASGCSYFGGYNPQRRHTGSNYTQRPPSRPSQLVLDPNLLNLSIGQLLTSSTSPTDPRIYDMECEISKLRLDLKYEKKARRKVESDLEKERQVRQNFEHERNLLLQVKKLKKPPPPKPDKTTAGNRACKLSRSKSSCTILMGKKKSAKSA